MQAVFGNSTLIGPLLTGFRSSYGHDKMEVFKNRVYSDWLNPGYWVFQQIGSVCACAERSLVGIPDHIALQSSAWLSIRYCLGYSVIHSAGIGDYETIQIPLVGLRKGARLYKNRHVIWMRRLVDPEVMQWDLSITRL